jgi:cystathionine gamma-synthase
LGLTRNTQLCQAIKAAISLPEGYTCTAFVTPDVWASNEAHAISEFRKEGTRLEASELQYHVVTISVGGVGGVQVRLYVVAFPMAKGMGALFQWQHGGLGFSTRLAEALLPHIDSMVYEGEFPDASVGIGDRDGRVEMNKVPPPTYLPETKTHRKLRERIARFLMRACANDHAKSVAPYDVFLYQTGMGAITRLHEAISAIRAGTTVVFGAVFHSTYHVFEENEGGVKHYGKADDADVDDFEKYLESGGQCSYVFTEFPSNPILVSVDLMRLRKLVSHFCFLILSSLARDDKRTPISHMPLLPAPYPPD